MKKLVSGGFVVFAGMVSVPAALAPTPVQDSRPGEHRTDPRIETLRSFFQRGECPAVEYVREFLEAADNYSLDWRLLPSLSYIESSGGKSARNNNLFGWDSGRAEFATTSAGIQEVGWRLSHSRLYRNKDLDGVLGTYNADADYARRVKSVMQQIAPGE